MMTTSPNDPVRMRLVRALTAAAVAASVAACAGCQQPARTHDHDTAQPPARTTTGPAQRIDAIQLLAAPTPINWDEQGGPDGVPVTVYLFQADRAEPVTLDNGALEFRLYDGRVATTDLFSVPPIHRWRFTAAQLQRARGRTIVGHCYRLPLDWGDDTPRVPRLSLVCLYEPTEGRTVASAPVTLDMRTR